MLMPGGSFIMPFTIVCQDITKLKVDVIVNASNIDLKMGGGVCGAIFKAAGAEKLQAVCDKLAPIEIGNAVITQGFDLQRLQDSLKSAVTDQLIILLTAKEQFLISRF